MNEEKLLKFCSINCLYAKDSYLNKNFNKNCNKNFNENSDKRFNKNIYTKFKKNLDKIFDKFDSNGLCTIPYLDDSKVKISHFYYNANTNLNKRVDGDKKLKSDKLKKHIVDFHRKMCVTKNLKTHFANDYFRNYDIFSCLSQLIISSSHYKTRIILCLTYNSYSNKFYITSSQPCFTCSATNKWFEKFFFRI